MSLTKRELVNEVASKLGLTQNEVAGVVQELLDAITDSLVDGNRLEIRNFGVFEVKEREARIGRNPRTGEEVPIPKKRVTTFRPGKALKQWVEAGLENRPHHLFKSEDYGEQTERSSSSSSSGPPSTPGTPPSPPV
jgi:integration host factor alpha subunit